jgi:two-component system, NtrC family, sensor histidine kinase HydH
VQTVAPLITALISFSLAVSMLIRDRRDRVFRRFAIFATIVAVVYLCMFFYVETRGAFWRYGFLLAGPFIAPTSLQVYHLLLRRYNPPTGPLVRALYVLAGVQVVVVALTARTFLYIFAVEGAVVFSGMAANVFVLWWARRGADAPVERSRLTWLALFGAASVLLMAVELIAQSWNLDAADLYGLSIPFPPVGTLATAAYIYFLGQIIILYRLLDLHEMVARMANFVVMSVLLAAVYAALVLWPGGDTQLPDMVVNTLMATAAMLILYVPLKEVIDRWTARLFFQERYHMQRAVSRLLRRLPGIFEVEALVDELLTSLTATSRVEAASVYLWSDEDRAYRSVAHLGEDALPELQLVPARPFAEGLLRLRAPLRLAIFRRKTQHAQLLPPARTDADAREREWQAAALHTMEGMGADITLPFLSGRSVLGWLNLRGERGNVGLARFEIGLLSDVVERVAAGIDASRQFERMKDRDRLATLGEMSAGLAHEIRNPLGAIKGAAQFIDETGVADDQQEFVHIIVEEVDRLNAVVTQFLDYARPMKLHSQETSMGPVLRSLVQALRAEGLPPGVSLELDVADDIPPVPVDPEKIRGVLLNLVRNAIEATTDGGEVRIEARYARALRRVRPLGSTRHQRRVGELVNALEGALELAISDDGVGIAPEGLTRLFIPFYTTKDRGNGLGLPVCERIVREHGGELDVQSTEGRGTRFVLRLPMNPETPDQAASMSLLAADE